MKGLLLLSSAADWLIGREKMNVDPLTKVLVFSDGLDTDKTLEIYKEFTGLIGISFGIGTHFSNDVGVVPFM